MTRTDVKKINGTVVIVPAGKTAYLIAEVSKLGVKEKKIIPFVKEPTEERVARMLRALGEKTKEIGIKLKKEIAKRRLKEVA